MNYDNIVSTALSYSMRTDQETADNIDNFISIAEARFTRLLDVRYLMTRATIQLTPGTQYYSIPAHLLSIRDIQINHSGGSISTLSYASPETFNDHISNGLDEHIYTFIGKQLQISPIIEGDIMEVVYLKQVEPLTKDNQYNPIGNQTPNVYIFGILAEISAYSKDYEAFKLWDKRFLDAISEFQEEDNVSRWSGPPLKIRMEQ